MSRDPLPQRLGARRKLGVDQQRLVSILYQQGITASTEDDVDTGSQLRTCLSNEGDIEPAEAQDSPDEDEEHQNQDQRTRTAARFASQASFGKLSVATVRVLQKLGTLQRQILDESEVCYPKLLHQAEAPPVRLFPGSKAGSPLSQILDVVGVASVETR